MPRAITYFIRKLIKLKQKHNKTNNLTISWVISKVSSNEYDIIRRMSNRQLQPKLHQPVLLGAALECLNPQPDENYLDLTAGFGGHAAAFLANTGNYQASCLVDRDELAISSLQSFVDRGVRLLHSDFASASQQLVNEGQKFDLIMVDLGVSSPQLDQGERGFSLTKKGHLDMRMDKRQALSAMDIVNSSSKQELVKIIHNYGEEPLPIAKKIAEAIIANRPIQETIQLADLVKKNYSSQWSRLHPATRTFQAIRIAVNDELGQLERLLPLLPKLLKPGGRVGVISFHSLEDRLVKGYFKKQQSLGLESDLSILTKKAIKGSLDDVSNPRARSAKLRVAIKK